MKRQLTIASIAAGLIGATLVFYGAPFQIGSRPIAGLMPAGALLYLEAKDFAGELHAWAGSQTKQRWLASARYQAFARSHLYLRLEEAWKDFGGAAGFVPDSAMLDSIAGRESGLALYDIGNLEFLYITRLASARAVETVLWQSRAKYTIRHAGRYDFFVRTGQGKVVAFAVADDHLLLGTREEFVAAALRLLSGEKLATIQEDGWYADTTGAARSPGDLRLVLNLEALVKSPHFRSYWIQRNAAEIRTYWAGIVDLRRTPGEIGEQRLFLRKNPAPPVSASPVGLLRLVPDDAAFYQAWAAPEVSDVISLIERKMLAPTVTAPRSDDFAPTAQVDAPVAGSEADLETRIDEPPLSVERTVALDRLRAAFAAAGIHAALQIQSSRLLHDGSFVDTPALLAIEAARDWDAALLRDALTAAASSIWTTQGLGAGWTERRRGARAWYELDGLAHLSFAAQGNLLLISNSADLLAQVLDRIGRPAAAADVSYAGGFRHSRARQDYRKLMAALETAQPAPTGFTEAEGTHVRFFSADLASLSDTLADVGEVELRAQDLGALLRETVTYRIQ